MALCHATASIDFWFVDFVIRESASTRQAPTNIHCPDGKPVYQRCKAIKSTDPQSLQVLLISQLEAKQPRFGRIRRWWVRERNNCLTVSLHQHLREPGHILLHIKANLPYRDHMISNVLNHVLSDS